MKRLILFIHGLGGNPTTTWGKFHDLIAEDQDLSRAFDCSFFKYTTSIWPCIRNRTARGQILADVLDTEISNRHANYSEITIIAHSLGGLITKRYIMDRIKYQQPTPVKNAIFFATPHLGSSLADIARLVAFNNKHLKQLCTNSEFVDMISREWPKLNLAPIEIINVIGSNDSIVNPANGTNLYREEYHTAEGKDHTNIVKPQTKDDISFIIVKKFLLETCTHSNNIIEDFKKNCRHFLNRNIESSKYIKDIFVESSDLKEYTRWFSDPFLFFKKYYTERRDFGTVQEFLAAVGFDGFSKLQTELSEPVNLSRLSHLCNQDSVLINENIKLITSIGDISHEWIENNTELTEDKRYYLSHRHPDIHADSIVRDLTEELNHINLFTNNSLLIISPAGYGKTNFICDFIENFFFKKSIPCLAFSGLEFDDQTAILQQIKTKLGSSVQDIESFADNFFRTNNKFTYILIDGLNENRHSSNFPTLITNFLTAIRSTKVKCILTCRTDCFDNFYRKTLPADVFLYDNNVIGTTYIERNALFFGYMKHFKIEIENYSDDVFETLTSNPLLLRFFCEAYKGTSRQRKVFVNLEHLHKAETFKLYYNNKLSTISASTDLEPFIKTKINDLILKIAAHMIKTETFSDIELAKLQLSKDELELINTVIEEDIILKADCISSPKDCLCLPIEVLNFTFDEFRDYIISIYLYTVIRKSDYSQFNDILISLNKTSSPATEGIFRYLFYHTRYTKDQEVARLLQHLNWYRRILAQEYYIIDDEFLTTEDLATLSKLFSNKYCFADFILRALSRPKCEAYKNFNLNFVITNILSQEKSVIEKVLIHNIQHNERHYSDQTYIRPQILIKKIKDEFNKNNQHKNKDLLTISIILYISNPYLFGEIFDSILLLLDNSIDLLALLSDIIYFIKRSGFSRNFTQKFIHKLAHHDKTSSIINDAFDIKLSSQHSTITPEFLCLEYLFSEAKARSEHNYVNFFE